MRRDRVRKFIRAAAALAAISIAAGAWAGRAPAPPKVEVGAAAPEIRSERWFNSSPLRPADLQGKVRLVEFWTHGCVNCVRTVPAMRRLHERFAGPDLVVIGVHTPEFARERDPKRVKEAIERMRIPYPVAMDNEGVNWLAWDNRYWPALYLVDRRGVIRHTHIGELHQGSKDWDGLLERIEGLRQES